MRLPRLRRFSSAVLAGIAGAAAGGLFAAAPSVAADSAGSPAPTATATAPAGPTPSADGRGIVVAPATVRAGRTVVISGRVPTTGAMSAPASDPVTLTDTPALFPPDGFGPQAARDATGAFRISYRVPDSTPAGTYWIGLRCGGGNVGVHAKLRVTTRSSHVPGGTPQTGATSPVGPGGQGGGGGTSAGGSATGWPVAGWLAAGATAGVLAGALGAAAWRRRRA